MENDFYSSISSYYQDIFKLSDNEKLFYKSLYMESKNILEIGSGSGELSNYIYNNISKNLDCIDNNTDFIVQGKIKYPDINFMNMDMKNINLLSKNYYDYVISVGNTLVHLDFLQIETFFKYLKQILKKDGIFVFQILNYSKIISQNILELPIIENEEIKFERFYKNSNDKILFTSLLTIKSSGKVIENSINLYPANINLIENLLKKNNYSIVSTYGDFEKSPFSETRFNVINYDCKSLTNL